METLPLNNFHSPIKLSKIECSDKNTYPLIQVKGLCYIKSYY